MKKIDDLLDGRLSNAAIDVLRNRKGFRHWYDNLDCDIQLDVQVCVEEAIVNELMDKEWRDE